jgi:hypothetical protein
MYSRSAQPHADLANRAPFVTQNAIELPLATDDSTVDTAGTHVVQETGIVERFRQNSEGHVTLNLQLEQVERHTIWR